MDDPFVTWISHTETADEDEKPKPKRQFEYRVAKAVDMLGIAQLNREFGSEGWELVVIIFSAGSWYYHFKRLI